jgi:hypothetical protein
VSMCSYFPIAEFVIIYESYYSTVYPCSKTFNTVPIKVKCFMKSVFFRDGLSLSEMIKLPPMIRHGQLI